MQVLRTNKEWLAQRFGFRFWFGRTSIAQYLLLKPIKGAFRFW